jgi:two-component system, LytTR family, sensor kinase
MKLKINRDIKIMHIPGINSIFRRKEKFQNLFYIFAFFLLIALFFSTTAYLGRIFGADWDYWVELRWAFGRFVTLALLTPFVIKAGRLLPINNIRNLRNIIIHLLLAILFTSLHIIFTYSINYLTIYSYSNFESIWVLSARFMHNDFVIYFIILIVSYFFDYYKKYYEHQIKTSQLEAELAISNLNALENQIHPHFLFNTLNAITSLISADQTKAVKMINRLSDLLRLTMKNSNCQEITVKTEFEYLNQYIEIMKIRFEDRLNFSISVEEITQDALIPNFLLQPLVENSIKHGINPRIDGGRVIITLNKIENFLVILIDDNGIGFKEDEDTLFNKGNGLSNLKERLDLLYGVNYIFKINNKPEGGVSINLHIPFHTTPL